MTSTSGDGDFKVDAAPEPTALVMPNEQRAARASQLERARGSRGSPPPVDDEIHRFLHCHFVAPSKLMQIARPLHSGACNGQCVEAFMPLHSAGCDGKCAEAFVEAFPRWSARYIALDSGSLDTTSSTPSDTSAKEAVTTAAAPGELEQMRRERVVIRSSLWRLQRECRRESAFNLALKRSRDQLELELVRSDEELAAAKAKSDELKEAMAKASECVVCLQQRADYSAPCGHFACLTCWKAMNQCPTCRKTVDIAVPGVLRKCFR
jgi:hypothetical protein